MKESSHLGNDIGDNFLNEAKIMNIYQTKHILQLAESSGPAGRRFLNQFQHIPSWIDLDLVRKGSEFKKDGLKLFWISWSNCRIIWLFKWSKYVQLKLDD